MVIVPLVPERGFHPDLDALGAAITPRTRLIWINSPHNPGAVFTAEEIAAIAALCHDHDLWLLSISPPISLELPVPGRMCG